MKKTFLFLMTLCFFAFTNKAISQTYSGGNGTESNPYLISSNADMVSLANAVNNGNNYSYNKYFLLTRDLAGVTTMIGYYGDYVSFQGTFDGGGHSLNVNIDLDNYDPWFYGTAGGAFGYLSGATIKNLTITGTLTGSNGFLFSVELGGICGSASSSTIINCANQAGISTYSYSSNGLATSAHIGGICGEAIGGCNISFCNNTGNIQCSTTPTYAAGTYYSGGICGLSTNNNINQCSNTGGVSASCSTAYCTACAGGICGFVSGTPIKNCYNTGSIASSAPWIAGNAAYSGGICGNASESVISNDYSTGNIKAYDYYAGGICGSFDLSSSINNCFVVASTMNATMYDWPFPDINWDYFVNRICGDGAGEINNCYALSSIQMNGATRNSSDATSKDGADSNISSFQSQSWITSNLQWDFTNVWYMPSSPGYPLLKKIEDTWPTGINEINPIKVSVYPNPVQNELFINSDLQIRKVEIYSLSGALLISNNNFNGKISLSSLLKGTYIVKIYTEKGLTVSKVLKE